MAPYYAFKFISNPPFTSNRDIPSSLRFGRDVPTAPGMSLAMNTVYEQLKLSGLFLLIRVENIIIGYWQW